MSEYQCHVCGETFESDWRAHSEPKYCPDCKAIPDSGKAVVYGLVAHGGPIRYVGHTTNPVERIMQHRLPDRYEDAMPALADWVRKVGPENIRMSIIRFVDKKKARWHEEVEIRRRDNLLNERAASKRIYTSEQAHAMLDRYFGE